MHDHATDVSQPRIVQELLPGLLATQLPIVLMA
jgi:hypothetical protein